jgi:hypothetical protein
MIRSHHRAMLTTSRPLRSIKPRIGYAHNADKEMLMPLYLTKFSHTPATLAKLITNTGNRRAAPAQYMESVGR